MDVIEKVDIPNDNNGIVKLNKDIYQNCFILPSQSIINYDLTPLKFNDSSYTEKDSKKVPSFVTNSIDYNNENDDMMMANHATSNPTSTSIWVPADKHPQISPNEYNDWIKIHTNEKHTGVTVSRKRSVLSTLSFNATDDDSHSSGSSTSDEEEEPVTPTNTNTMHSLPDAFAENLKEDQLEKDSKEEANEQKIAEALPCRQASHVKQETSLNRMEDDSSIPLQQLPKPKKSTILQSKEQAPIIVPRVATTPKSPDTLNADLRSKKDKKSWFSGLLHDLKKTSKPQKSKKTGLSSLFSKSSSSSPSKKQETAQTKSSNTGKTQQASPNSSSLSLSSTKPPNAKPKKKKLESEVSKHIVTQRNIQPLPQRYPLNTERAIYRLSHVKLGNPRRPLQQQVVISNMMYWYLSIQQQQQQQQQQNYHYNKRQQVYFNNIYQATYQSFEPPTPGGGYHQHQPHFHSYPTMPTSHHQQQSFSYYTSSPVQQLYDESYHATTAPQTTEKPKTSKKKYKPVRNSQYDPMVFENAVGIQTLL
ncbi:hypothetical protein HMPREF1544_03213 [Mucor circinelloides 1006PhL]|uniref:Protein Zds1 C-terminal domain-containing protein n=1 Tax=Mucor circinelloides f. circinelloides (strain 1006PhL) TaxID=1220926 RepID=S2JJ84_MUCC1|nr:hypothetical protein HMPREF1544_03213 [Mucor circinelloides 1006PhL]